MTVSDANIGTNSGGTSGEAGIRFTQPPTEMASVTTAVFDDTCGNLIQIATEADPRSAAGSR